MQVDMIRKAIINSKTFDELIVSIENRSNSHLYHIEVMDKINSLPIVYRPELVEIMCNYIHNQDDVEFWFEALRTYSTRLVTNKLLETPGMYEDDKNIPIIVFTSRAEILSIAPEYLQDAFNDVAYLIDEMYTPMTNTDFVIRVFTNDSSIDNEMMDSDTKREVIWIKNILHSENALLTYIDDHYSTITSKRANDNLYTRAKVIHGTIKAHSGLDLNEINITIDDVYAWYTYMIATFDYVLKHWSTHPIYTPQQYINQSVSILLNIIPTFDARSDLLLKIIQEATYVFDEKEHSDKLLEIKAIIRQYPELFPDLMIGASNDLSVVAMEAYDKTSSNIDRAGRKIYSGFKAYKDAENKVDSQLSKLTLALKNLFTGKQSARDKLIEGEEFSVIKVIKRIVTTSAIFSYSKVAGILYLITKHYLSNKVTKRERNRLVSELELEIKLLDEKIDDARGDGNRQAKYAMMRTRAELQKALEQIRYGLTADEKALKTARAVVSGKKSLEYTGPSKVEED